MAATLSVLIVASAGLTGCRSQSESYCSTLREDQKQLKRLAATSAEARTKTRTGTKTGRGSAALADTVDLLSGLRSAAPDQISGDYDTLVEALSALSDAVRASGADPADFAGGSRPDGVTEGQYSAVTQAATRLQSTPVQQSAASIEQHARDVCKVDLGAGLGGAG